MTYFIGKNKFKKLACFWCILSLFMFITGSFSNARCVTRIHGIEVSDPCQVKIFVSVFEARLLPDEEPIMGYIPLELDAAAFEIYIDGKQIGGVRANIFETSPEGIDVVLALDISGSVFSKFDFVRDAVKTYIDKRRSGKDQIAILTFGSDVQFEKFTHAAPKKISAFTDDIDQLKQAIENDPEPHRRQTTVLFKAITSSIELAAQGRLDTGTRKTQKAVIVLSDGHDEGTGFNIEDCISSAKSKGIPIFSLAIPDEKGTRYYHDNLEKISLQTGGIFVPVNHLDKLEPVYRKLDELIKKQYVLDFKLPVRISDGKKHKLQIFTTYKKQTIGSDIFIFQPGLRPCPSIVMVTGEQLGKIKSLQEELEWPDNKLTETIKDSFGTVKIEKLEQTEAAELIESLEKIIVKVRRLKDPRFWVYIIVGLILLGAVILVAATLLRLRSLKRRNQHQEGN